MNAKAPGARPAVGRKVPATLLLCGLLMAMVGILASPASARSKPDLVIGRAHLDNPFYAFFDKLHTFSVDFVTKNEGRRRAGSSITYFELRPVEPGYPSLQLGWRVGRLGPLKSSDLSKAPTTKVDLVPGAYTVRFCADAEEQVVESDEGNNCKTIKEDGRPAPFFVSKRAWSGSISGKGFLAGPNTKETWRSGNATLDFDHYEDPGRFVYGFRGDVSWTASGTLAGAGCIYTGHGTKSITANNAGSAFTLDFYRNEYKGAGTLFRTFYKIHTACPFVPPQTLDGPLGANVGFLLLVRQDGTTARRLPFGTLELKDDGANPNTFQTWKWDLK